jgi:hypothetical protein
MNGSVTVRQAEDLEGGALTYAEIKTIASGDPAVMEMVKVDTEIRKLDQLRASHINQQHQIRWEVKNLPERIESARRYHASVSHDLATRDAHAGLDFTMRVGTREFSGKGAREEAAKALNGVVMSWRNDRTLKVRAHYRGFEILSRGAESEDGTPEIYVGGRASYKANLNPESPLGTIASIDAHCAHSTAWPRMSNAPLSGMRSPGRLLGAAWKAIRARDAPQRASGEVGAA